MYTDNIVAYIEAAPIPDIKANGSDGPLELSIDDTLSLTIALEPGDYSGDLADWWVVAQTPMGWYYKTVGGPWQPGLAVTHQGPLFNLSTREVLHTSSLPSGLYTFRFGVDMDMNGKINMNQMYHDSVVVNIALTQITNDPAYDGSPALAPDGSKIVFFSNRLVTFKSVYMGNDSSIYHEFFALNKSPERK